MRLDGDSLTEANALQQRKPMNPGKGFQRKPGKEYKGFSAGKGFQRKAAPEVFVDEDGCAYSTGHQDPHGVYRDVDPEANRGGVRAYRVPGRQDAADVDTSDEPVARKPVKRRKRSAPKSDEERAAARLDAQYLAACRGEQCFLRFAGICIARGFESETVVPAHRNEGKGMGLKVPDSETVPACYACHMEFDQGRRFTREHKRAMWLAAFKVWEPVRLHKIGMAEIPQGVTV